jgi:hypothetical protein
MTITSDRLKQARNKRYLRYLCPSCEKTHESEFSAQECCPPEVEEVYVCPECEETHGTADDAEKCEAGHGNEFVSDPLSLAKCPVCMGQQDDIEDAVEHCLWKRMGWAERDQLIRDVRLGRHRPESYRSH